MYHQVCFNKLTYQHLKNRSVSLNHLAESRWQYHWVSPRLRFAEENDKEIPVLSLKRADMQSSLFFVRQMRKEFHKYCRQSQKYWIIHIYIYKHLGFPVPVLIDAQKCSLTTHTHVTQACHSVRSLLYPPGHKLYCPSYHMERCDKTL